MAITFMDRLISDLKEHVAEFTKHVNNLTTKLHITADERTSWNDAKTTITTHAGTGDIHVTKTEKDRWNALTAGESAASVRADLDAHTNNGNIHLTTTEKTKVGYLSTTTSDVQVQLNNKAPLTHITDTVVHVTEQERNSWNNKCPKTLTHAFAVVVTDGDKNITSQGSITDTELSQLDGVTDNIQQQLNAKCPKSLGTGNRVVITDGSGNITISTALTDPSKLQYLSGVTSDVQTQLNSKAPSSHTSDTTLHTNDTERSTWNAKQDTTLATANAVVVTDSSKKILASTTITTTELGYLDGVTSNVQTQLNAKAPNTHVGDSTHISEAERTNWNAKPRIWSTTKTLSGDLNGQVLTITHTLGVAPKMVFAYISTGGTTELNAGTTASPITLFVFATVPLVGGTASTTQIDVLIPDVATSSSTVLTISALY